MRALPVRFNLAPFIAQGRDNAIEAIVKKRGVQRFELGGAWEVPLVL